MPGHNEDGNEKSEHARALNALNRRRRRRKRSTMRGGGLRRHW
jgi:hypothetical protein